MFTKWHNAVERVKWTKLMQIIHETGMDWRERRLISKLYMDQSIKYDWTKVSQNV